METTQRLEAIQNFLRERADDRFINLVFGMMKAEEDRNYKLSDSHKEILDQRLKEFDTDPTRGVSWESLKNTLR